MIKITDIINELNCNTQSVLVEIIKLLLRKSIKPNLNNISNAKIVYNSYKQKYERGYVSSAIDDIVNQYTYVITNDSIGWNSDIVVHVKIVPKSTKKIFDYDKCNRKKINIDTKTILDLTNDLTEVLTNNRSNIVFNAAILYHDAFKLLQLIGQDIIDQTAPEIAQRDSARMSTAKLRIELYLLELALANFSVTNAELFDSYIKMIKLINSLPKNKTPSIISLIATLAHIRWEDLIEEKRQQFLHSFGQAFINSFLDNKLITMLLSSDKPELVLVSAYMFPLLKTLFIVFGYSKLVPNIVDTSRKPTENHYKHFNRNMGSRIIRSSPIIDNYSRNTNGTNGQMESESSDDSEYVGQIDEFTPRTKLVMPDPVDFSLYQHIRMFGELYPTIVGLMGGTENFPKEDVIIDSRSINPTFVDLTELSAYLWRFNDWSYCRYLELIASKQILALSQTKINDKYNVMLLL